MAFFDATITDWIVAFTSIGIAGAASKVALEELPKWRMQRDAEAWDRSARTILECAQIHQQKAFQAVSLSESEILKQNKNIQAENCIDEDALVRVSSAVEASRAAYMDLMNALENGEAIWPGEIEEYAKRIHLAQEPYIREIVENMTALQRGHSSDLARIEKRILDQPVVGLVPDRTSPAFLALHTAVEKVKPIVRFRLFGRQNS